MEQAEEVRELSVNASVDVAEPIKRHATHQAEQVRAMSKKVTAEAAEAIKRQASNLEQDCAGRAEQRTHPKCGHFGDPARVAGTTAMRRIEAFGELANGRRRPQALLLERLF